MRRAAVSISSNIAEGSARNSRGEFARYVQIAFGSALEVVSQATIARDLEYLRAEDYRSVYEDSKELTRMLSGLRSHLLSK